MLNSYKTTIYFALILLGVVGCGGKNTPVGQTPLYGNAVGNGGDVIVCNGKPPILLDVWELRELNHERVSLGDSQGTYINKATEAINRLSNLDKERSKRYLNLLNSFETEAVFLKGAELTDIPDSLNVALPMDCELKQIAVQQKQNTEKDPKYVLNKDLWDQLDTDNQAGLALHEIIYREAYEYRKHTDSRRVRKFNGYVLSENGFHGYDAQKYRELLRDLQLPHWMNNVPVKPESVVLSNVTAAQAEVVEAGAWIQVGVNRVHFGGNFLIEFHPSGAIRKGSRGWTEMEQKTSLVIGSNSFKFECGAFIELYEGGAVKAAHLGEFSMSMKDVPVSFSTRSDQDRMAKFYESGNLMEATLAAPATLQTKNDGLREYKTKTRLFFDEEGFVEREVN